MRRRLWLQQRSWTCVGAQLAITAGLVDALPVALEPRQSEHMQDSTNRRNDPGEMDNSVSPKVWVPAVGVVIVIICIFFFMYTRTSVLSRMRRAIVRARQSSNDTSTSQENFNGTGTREVTAQQLTGVGRNTTVNANRNRSNAGVGRTNPRTGRRNRRTPSQMSTHSLPMYMKEPGDQELVIFTGPEAVDVDVSIAEAREAEDRDDGRDSDSLRREATRDSEVAPEAVVRETVGGELLGPGPRPDQSAMSLGLSEVGAGAEREHDPDTSTTQLLPQRSSIRRENDDSQQRRDPGISGDTASALMQRRASLVPSEAPPDYEVTANPDNLQNNARSGDLTRVRESVSTASHGIEPPGLSEQLQSGPGSNESYPPSNSSQIHPSTPSPLPSPRSSRLLGAGDRRSRLASRVSQFLHLRNTANVNSANTAFPVSEGADGGRSSDAVVESGSGLPLVSGSRTNSRLSNSISLNDLSSGPSAQQAQGQGSGQQTQIQQRSHRHSHSSASMSAFHLPLRTLSRPRSSNTLSSAFGSRSNVNLHSHSHTNSIPNATNANANANSTTIASSPSTLSLAQSILAGQTHISAPLPHTLVRTEIRYPAGGPTPEQLKLLSSRDVLGRFAVPYGESAVEFARSSRLEVGAVDEEPPPPAVVFEGDDEEGDNGEERGQEEGGGSGHRNNGSGSSGVGDDNINNNNTQERERRSEDTQGSNDVDALPIQPDTDIDSVAAPISTPPQTHRRNRSVEDVPVQSRVLLPLFL